MNVLIISFLAVASLSTFPTCTYGTPATSGGGVHDPKKSVAAVEAVQPVHDNGLKEIWQEDDREVLIRNERGTKNGGGAAGKRDHKKDKTTLQKPSKKGQQGTRQQEQLQQQQQQQQQQLPPKDSQCRYTKGPWTECDAKTNTRSRTLALKKGEETCVQTRTIQKKCKKACRYDKGTWSECDSNGQMSRADSLKQGSDTTCHPTRVVNKNCNQGKSKDKQNKPPKAEKKEKGVRKNRQ